VISKASVRCFLSRTQSAEQSKFTNPHCSGKSQFHSETYHRLGRTLWKLTQKECATALISARYNGSRSSGHARATPAIAASM